MTKTCTGPCGRDLPLDAFGLHPKGRHGRQAKCRECYKLGQRRSTPAAIHNRELASLREVGVGRCNACGGLGILGGPLPHDFGPNRAQRFGFARQCRRCTSRAAVTRARIPERAAERKAYHDEWRKRDPEAARRRGYKARSARRARLLDAFVEHVDRDVVFQRDGGTCGICGLLIDGPMDVDHVVPLALGGEHSYANVRASHMACNRARNRF